MEGLKDKYLLWEPYTNEFANSLKNNWERDFYKELLVRYDHPDTEFPLKLILIHPRFYSSNPTRITGNRCDVRGDFNFQTDSDAICNAKKYWGYSCPIQEPAIHRDHIFPYSLGGPSVSSNCIWLCEWHNSLRSYDPHVIPDADKEPRWFKDVLAHVKRKLQ